LFDSAELREAGAPFDRDAALVVGGSPRHNAVAAAVNRATARGVQSDGDATLTLFADDGYAIAECGDIWLAASFARAPEGASGGHYHNDLLSFELCWRGADLFVDGGSYLYTPSPELRNRFRS